MLRKKEIKADQTLQGYDYVYTTEWFGCWLPIQDELRALQATEITFHREEHVCQRLYRVRNNEVQAALIVSCTHYRCICFRAYWSWSIAWVCSSRRSGLTFGGYLQ